MSTELYRLVIIFLKGTRFSILNGPLASTPWHVFKLRMEETDMGVAVNVLNKQYPAAEKRRSSNLGVERGVTTPHF
jgi:hypothetical protein